MWRVASARELASSLRVVCATNDGSLHAKILSFLFLALLAALGLWMPRAKSRVDSREPGHSLMYAKPRQRMLVCLSGAIPTNDFRNDLLERRGLGNCRSGLQLLERCKFGEMYRVIFLYTLSRPIFSLQFECAAGVCRCTGACACAWSEQSEQPAARGVTYSHGMCICMHVCMSTWLVHVYARAHVYVYVWLSLLIDRARVCPSYVVALVFVASGARGWRSHHSCYLMLCMA